MKKTAMKVTGEDLVKTAGMNHPKRAQCPVCSKSCSTTALVKLVYTFEVCDCSIAPYRHLFEKLYHRNCFEEQFRKLEANDEKLGTRGR